MADHDLTDFDWGADAVKAHETTPFDNFDWGDNAVKTGSKIEPESDPSFWNDSMWERYLGAMGEIPLHYASSMLAKTASDFAGVAAIPANALGMDVDPTAVKESVQSSLTYPVETETAKQFTESKWNPLNMLGKTTGWVGQGAHDLISDPNKLEDSFQNILGNASQEFIHNIPALYGAKGSPLPGYKATSKWLDEGKLGTIGDTITGNVKSLQTKALQGMTGSEFIPAVTDALRNVKVNKPTAAEALVDTNVGSPIQAMQKITAESPGGISDTWSSRIADQIAYNKSLIQELGNGIPLCLKEHP